MVRITVVCLSVLLVAEVKASAFGDELSALIHRNVRIHRKDITEKCALQVDQYLQGIHSKQSWALTMLDATSKLQSGLLSGNIAHFGDFDQCLDVKYSTGTGTISGKYCLGEVGLKNGSSDLYMEKDPKKDIKRLWYINEPRIELADLGATYATSACLPDGCTDNDFELLVSTEELSFTTQVFYCQTSKSNPKITTGDIIVMSFFGTIILLAVVSTSYEAIVTMKKKEVSHPSLVAFSLLSNGKRLFDDNRSSISSLHGIRAITMMWLIIQHRFLVDYNIGAIENWMDVFEWIESPGSMYILNGNVAADTFIFLGAVVVSYPFVYSSIKGFKNNALYYVEYTVGRYIRLTLPIAAIMLIDLTLLKHLGSGPLWPKHHDFMENCQNYWWAVLLYIQNYTNHNKMCISESWYLDIEVQLYFLAPIVILPMVKFPKCTSALLLLLAAMSSAAGGIVGWILELNAIYGGVGGTKPEFMKYYYNPTHMRVTPWIFGFLLGYVIYRINTKRKRVKMSKVVCVAAWLTCLATMSFCVFGGHNLITDYNRLASAFHMALVRFAWSLGLCWVVFACEYGYGGPLSWFLALPVFQLLSRITFCMYLLHFTVMYMLSLQTRSPIRFANGNGIFRFLGNFLVIVGLGIVWILLFELPMVEVAKAVFGKIRRPRKEKPPPKKLQTTAL